MDAGEIRAQFNDAAPGYGGWHRRYAKRLIELTPLAPGQRVLDVGTGTGLAAFAAAGVVGPRGHVVGIDIAERMVAEARRAAAEAGLSTVEFRVGDGSRLPFDRASFDAVVCSSAIIYLPLPDAVYEWWRVLGPGGIAAFSTLRDDSPRTGVVFREVAATFGVPLDNPNAIGSPASCRALMEAAGFDDIAILAESIPAELSTPEKAWEGNVGSAVFAAVRRLSPADLGRMHSAYIAALTASDLAAPYGVMYVVARRPLN